MSELSPASRPRLANKARLKWDRHANKHMLLYPEHGLLLNDSAASILQLCDGQATIAEIAQTLAATNGGAREKDRGRRHRFRDDIARPRLGNAR